MDLLINMNYFKLNNIEYDIYKEVPIINDPMIDLMSISEVRPKWKTEVIILMKRSPEILNQLTDKSNRLELSINLSELAELCPRKSRTRTKNYYPLTDYLFYNFNTNLKIIQK